RRTLQLLNHFRISKPLLSYYKDVEHAKAGEILARLRQGESAALVTDAGTPAVSDPGSVLVREAVAQGVRVEVIPGASALLVALLGSGLNAEAFTFQGFLDTRRGQRLKKLEALKARCETQVFFISPHQARAVVADFAACWGERPAVLGRELTKLHEEYLRGSLPELSARLEASETRGEYTLVVGGNPEIQSAPEKTESIEAQLARLRGEGLSLNQAVARIARERALPRQEVYALAHQKPGKLPEI
ncbi:MAG: rRNA small subunit methyltransferase 1, partial [Desulfobulbaceae bacterium]|nr:rRNA small subunit methyltransferase 1 [Desulfobulbaceae bacterium]